LKAKKIKNGEWMAWNAKLPIYNMGKAYGKTELEAINNLE
jgi:hypothetical protein